MARSYLAVLIIIFTLFGCAHSNTQLKETVQDTDRSVDTDSAFVEEVKSHFESHLFLLPPRKQGHYGLRLYRVTGDTRYINAALYDYYAIADYINAVLPHLHDEDYIAQQAALQKEKISNGKRGKARRKTLKTYPDFVFYGKLLNYAARLNEYGYPVPDKVITALDGYDFMTVLTSKKMIRAWAAQLANHAYWLTQLGINDYTQDFQHAFQNTYPDENDSKLSRWQYKNKVYGLTHIIFAASGYYQQTVSAQEYEWILEYFSTNADKILKDTSADVIAEVAISFLLTEQNHHPFIDQAKRYLLNKYSAEHSMIPSVSGKIDLETGEHRNVLALMLFNWPDQLFVGPCLSQMEVLEDYLPASTYNWSAKGEGSFRNQRRWCDGNEIEYRTLANR